MSLIHPIPDSTSSSHALDLLTETGLGGMADVIQLLMNEAMKIERSQELEAWRTRTLGEHTYLRHPAP